MAAGERSIRVYLDPATGKQWFLPEQANPRRWRGPYESFGKLTEAALKEVEPPFSNILVTQRKP